MYTIFGLIPKKMNAKVRSVGLSGWEGQGNPNEIQGNPGK
jgi:hypothetical protein